VAVGGLELSDVDVAALPGASPSSRYDVFVSYAHEDARLAERLRWGLLRLGRPFWRTSPRLRVFLDKATMSASSALWPSICRALDDSEWFVLLASPASARSRWVGRELKRWLATRSADRLLVVLVDGTITWDDARGDVDLARSTAWPPVLAGAFAHEPRITDLRGVGDDDLTMANPAFVDAVADVGATVSRVPKETLHGAEVRERRRSRRALQATVGVLAVLLAVALVAVTVAVRQLRESERAHALALARMLVARSEEQATVDPRLAMLLAATAWDHEPSPEARAAMVRRAAQPLVGVIPPPEGEQYSTAVSPDGARIATLDAESSTPTLTVHDVATGQAVRQRITTDLPELGIAAFGPGGLVALVSYGFAPYRDQKVVVWDSAQRHEVGRADIPGERWVTAAVFSGDGGSLAVGADALPDGPGSVVALIDPTTGHPRGAPIELPVNRHVADLEFSPDGQQLAIADIQGGIELRDVASHRTVRDLTPRREGRALDNYGQRLAFDGDGSRLVATGSEGTRLWDLRSPEAGPVSLDGDGADDVVFSAGGDQVIGVTGPLVTFWDVATRQPVGPALALDDRTHLTAIAVSADGRYLVSSSDRGGAIRIWDLTRYRRLGTTQSIPGAGEPFEWHHEAISYSPDGTTLATAGPDGIVRLGHGDPPGEDPADLPGQEPAEGIEGFQMAWTADGATLVTSTADGTGIRSWSARTRQPTGAPPPVPGATLRDLAISPGGHVATVWSDGVLRRWEIGTWEPIPDLTVGTPVADDIPEKIWFGPDDTTLYTLVPTTTPATGASDTVAAWDLTTGQRGAPLRVGDGQRVEQISVSGDGRWLGVATADDTVTLWDLEDRAKVFEATTSRSADRPVEIAVRDDGRALAYVAWDGTIRVGHVDSGEELARLADSDPTWKNVGGAVELAFRPHSDVLTVVWQTWEMDRWSVPVPDDLVAELCATAHRPLTPEEWRTHVADGAPRNPCPGP
jgi:WD40 repeat protein